MQSDNLDLPVAHTIRELAFCRDDNSIFWLKFNSSQNIYVGYNFKKTLRNH